jgi:DNA-binding NtrC family response regulator
MVTDLVSAPTNADAGSLVLTSLFDICGAKRGIIAKLNGLDGLALICMKGFDPSNELPQEVHTLMQKVMAEGHAFTVGKSGESIPFQNQERISARKALCIPLVEDTQTIGCLYLDEPQRNSSFSKSDLDLVATVTDYIADVLVTDKPPTNGLSREEEKYARELEKEGIIARSPKTLRVFQDSRKISPFHVAVLIYGETGSGKEVIARYIHDHSGRTGAFIPCNCSAITASMFESELFGHEKGAFTGAVAKKPGLLELADGGTIFLDEIGDMPVEQQSKLLRALQEQEVWRVGGQSAVKIDVRVTSATHKDIKNKRKELNFRDDLYYRLANVEITAPSLKERIEDIGPLSHLILRDLSQRHLKAKKSFSISPKALKLLEAYDWPGNIRELRNTLFQAAYRCDGNTIERHHLKDLLDVFEASPQTVGGTISPMIEVEREHLIMTLEYTNWNKSAAAKALKMDRNRLSRRLKKLGIKKNSG